MEKIHTNTVSGPLQTWMEEEGTLQQLQQKVTQLLCQNTDITLLKSTHPTDQLLLS